MMFVCTDSEPDDDRTDDCDSWAAENDAAGRRMTGSALAPVDEAVTVRVRAGKLLRSSARVAAGQCSEPRGSGGRRRGGTPAATRLGADRAVRGRGPAPTGA